MVQQSYIKDLANPQLLSMIRDRFQLDVSWEIAEMNFKKNMDTSLSDWTKYFTEKLHKLNTMIKSYK